MVDAALLQPRCQFLVDIAAGAAISKESYFNIYAGDSPLVASYVLISG